MESEIRDLLNLYKYNGDEIPIIRGSALFALEGKDSDGLGKAAILKVRTLSAHVCISLLLYRNKRCRFLSDVITRH